jgi:putative acyl-CoA dehydrogenase
LAEALNQPPPLVDDNVFEADAPLREALEREGAGWAYGWASELGWTRALIDQLQI